MENRLLKDQNIPLYQIDIQGVRGNGAVRKLLAPFKILKATLSAMRYMKQLKIDAVAGFGGYVGTRRFGSAYFGDSYLDS